ncbi:DUF3298 and DUF4163 domain-containing protein [Changchengzhania lutea]|uniref:DUF3298 and DUF4163 domain-containing protein n=1 Tax=Changchengzhania lutea TaxID=2049305 RepID=UPI00163DAC6E|nr:DUF3298 and DUF4163 domain-containing protein [Changchengzhania lutea]
MKKYGLILCVYIVLFSCEQPTKLLFAEVDFTSNNDDLVTVNIPVATEGSVISEYINSEIHSQVISVLSFDDSDDENAETIEESIANFNNAFVNFQNDFPERAQEWEAQIDGDVMFQSEEIISIALSNYINTGGAHGILTIVILNFDAKTGSILTSGNLINNPSKLKAIAEPYFREALQDQNMTFNSKDFKLPRNIGYSDDGLVFVYNINETDPYSDGIIEFVIPYNKINSLLVFDSAI